jgi:hypothetical protein
VSSALVVTYCVAVTGALVGAILTGAPGIVLFLVLCALGVAAALRSDSSAD